MSKIFTVLSLLLLIGCNQQPTTAQIAEGIMIAEKEKKLDNMLDRLKSMKAHAQSIKDISASK